MPSVLFLNIKYCLSKCLMYLYNMRYNNDTITKTTITEVDVKQRKNGDWFANLSKLETSVIYNQASKTVRQAKGRVFKSVTITSTWNSEPYSNQTTIIWNEL